MTVEVTDTVATAVVPDEDRLDRVEQPPDDEPEIAPGGAHRGGDGRQQGARAGQRSPSDDPQHVQLRRRLEVAGASDLCGEARPVAIVLVGGVDRDREDLETFALETVDLVEDEGQRHPWMMGHQIGDPSTLAHVTSRSPPGRIRRKTIRKMKINTMFGHSNVDSVTDMISTRVT